MEAAINEKFKGAVATAILTAFLAIVVAAGPFDMAGLVTHKARGIGHAVNWFATTMQDSFGRWPAAGGLALLGFGWVFHQLLGLGSLLRAASRAIGGAGEALSDARNAREQASRPVATLSGDRLARLRVNREQEAAVLPNPAVSPSATAEFIRASLGGKPVPTPRMAEPSTGAATLAALEAIARKELSPDEYWPMHDHIAWYLQGSDTITFRSASEVLRDIPGYEDVTLTDADFQEIRRLWEEKRRPTKPHGRRIRPVVLARMARERGVDWSGAGSHLGGMPRLGEALWPRGRNQLPLPFVAQIDLAEIAAKCPESPLPHQGSLAFFINDGAVIHVPPGASEPAVAPADLPHAFEEGGYPLPEEPGLLTHPLFPFWPLEPIGLKLPDDLPLPSEEEDDLEAIRSVQTAALHNRLPRREYAFSVSSARKDGCPSADTMWWYGAQHVARCLHKAVDGSERRAAFYVDSIAKSEAYRARLESEIERDAEKIAAAAAATERYREAIPRVAEQSAGLEAFVAEFDRFVTGRDPWSVMRANEVQVLKEAMAETRKSFEELCRFVVPSGLDDLRNLTIRRMITGDEAALAALPDELLGALNRGYRLTSAAQHQMFGLGECIQTALYDHLGDLLLLQIGYDDLPEMCFGDVGVWQWWISPEDAAARRWDKVKLTFECH